MAGPGAEWKNERDAAQLFDRAEIPSPQEVRGLAPPHVLPVACVEIRRDPDKRLHYFGGSGAIGAGSPDGCWEAASSSGGTPRKRTGLSPFRCSGVIT